MWWKYFLVLLLQTVLGSLGHPFPRWDVGGLGEMPSLLYDNITPDNRTLCPETPENRPPDRVNTTDRLAALRAVMADPAYLPDGVPYLDAYFIPVEDEHMDEGADHDKRLEYISGYSGSAGYAWVTSDVTRAALWTDGRYWTQADSQMDCNWILMEEGQPGYPTAPEWFNTIYPEPDTYRVGIDSRLVSISRWQYYEANLNSNIQLVDMLDHELIDVIWTEDRPPRPNNEIYEHTIDFSGRIWGDKIAEVRQDVADRGADVLAMHALDETAWLFNTRGSDRDTSPFFYSYAILLDSDSADAIRLYLVNFLDLIADAAIQTHLNTQPDGSCPGPNPDNPCANVRDYSNVMADLAELANDDTVGTIWLDPGANYALYNAAGDDKITQTSPIQSIKSVKNEVERARFPDSLMRDSAAQCEFLAELQAGVLAGENWTELSASNRLTEIRSTYEYNRGISFHPISAVGANAAVIHYRPSEATDAQITTNEVYLLDSGGQYLDGTTDTTRTFHFGTPTAQEIEAYTRVLMGHIDVASMVFPTGTTSSALDSHSRAPLWEVGLDYDHSPSHGIGYFLDVHESFGAYTPGHFVTNEPGYYEVGSFGIRLENTVSVEVADTPNNHNGLEYLTFKSLILIPFEPHMIDYSMLTDKHIEWLNEYNDRCEEEVGTYLLEVRDNQEAYDWLMARTADIPLP